jgi:signal peptidase I
VTTIIVAAAGGLAALACATVLVRARLMVVDVHGGSMEPTLAAGDRVLARRGRRVSRGAIVVIEPPPGAVDPADVTGQFMVKRVLAVPGDPVPREDVPALAGVVSDRVPPGRLVVIGDNAMRSHDSRVIGYFEVRAVRGTVLRRVG